LRLRSGEAHREQIALQLEPYLLGGARYLPVPAEPEAALTVERATSGDMFKLRFATRIHGPCMRCLNDAVVDIAVAAQEYHSNEERAPADLRSDYVVDGQLLLSAWGRDAIALQLPDQILCQPECAGLCQVCGANLNTESHVHEEEIVHTRWAALESLRDEL
jgi:DUF177 domain-containing protein